MYEKEIGMTTPELKPNGEKSRIGVYICHCGTNIAKTVDVEALREFAEKLPDVVAARTYKFVCSDPGQKMIRDDIQDPDLKVNRVVFVGCTPRLHEMTFRKVISEAGLNEYYLQVANIREHVSWVTPDKEEGTEKAKALLAGAVRRVHEHEALEQRRVPVNPDVLIVGGGIAGITAALTIADAGKKVYLVEREPSIGGYMAKFDKTFPTLDCSACILTPKMSSVKSHPNITLWAYSEVAEVDGYVGNFKIKIRRKPRYVDEDTCAGCYDCVEACVFKKPKFPDEFEVGMGLRKPIYIPFPQATPLKAVIDPNTCLQLTTGKCKQSCAEVCSKNSINFDQVEEIKEIEVGTVILATGFKAFDPVRSPEYGYGKYDNVYTSVEVERLCNAAGPTGGNVVLRDGTTPKSIAIVHCVGSRDKKTNAWCSRACCMYSLKLAHLVKERTDGEVFNFYIDMRTPGKSYEEFYDKILDEGVHFIRGRAAEVRNWALDEAEEGKLVVRAEDSMMGVVRRIPVDMVILSVGLEPHEDANEVARMFNMSCGTEGWFTERHPKLAPVHTFTDGVFIAGACQGPKDIPDSVSQAGAAASEVLALIDKGYIELEPNTAFIDEDKCSGCHTCIALCPYTAISFNEEKGKAEINEALCKGCGTCVAACPAGAAQQHHFTDDQIYEEIEGVLEYV